MRRVNVLPFFPVLPGFFAQRYVRFASFLSGGFITAIVVNPPERKLAKLQWLDFGKTWEYKVHLI
jgi:hypothetical protein